MTEDQLRDELDKWESVHYQMQDKGIDYCFQYYSSFRYIDDKDFHVIREKLINSMNEMCIYVQNKIVEIEDKIIELDDSNIIS
jgi:hypothetical protein